MQPMSKTKNMGFASSCSALTFFSKEEKKRYVQGR